MNFKKRLDRNADSQAALTEAKLRRGVCFGGKGSAPAAPDYTGAAREQAAASSEIATQQTWANRPTQNTPWGSTSWGTASAIDPATGQPVTQWTQNQTLDPALQSALDDQLAIQAGRSNLAGQFMNRVASDYSTPFNWQGAPGMAQTPDAQFTRAENLDKSRIGQTTQTTNEPAFADYRNKLAQASFERMQPGHQRAQEQLETQLVNQGLTRGSAAWNESLQQLQQAQAGERFNALEQSGNEQARMQQMLMGQQQQAFGQAGTIQQLQNAALQAQFGQNLGANAQNWQQMMQQAQFQNQNRQQFLAEEAMRRGMSLNEMNALLTGSQVGTPQMPSFMGASAGQAPNLLGAAQAQGNYDLGAAKLAGEESSNMWGGIGKMAGMAGMMMMSDRRLKSNVKRIGTHPLGIGVYSYTMFGRPGVGVMAQDLLAIRPDLVYTTPSGYLAVNYGGL